MLQDHDIVADRQPDGRYVIREWVNGRLTPIRGYSPMYQETEMYRCLDELRSHGDTYMRESPDILLLVQPR